MSNKKRKKRKGLNYLICVILGILSMAAIIVINWRRFEDQTGQRLDNILSEIEMYYDSYTDGRELLTDFEVEVNGFFAEYLAGCQGNAIEKQLDVFAERFPEKDIYFIQKDGKIRCNVGAENLDDPETLLEAVKENGYVRMDETIYAGASAGDGYLLIAADFSISDELADLFTVPNSADDTICFDMATQKATMASQSKFKGIDLGEFLNDKAYLVKAPAQDGGQGIGYNKHTGYFVYKQNQLNEDTLLIAYADMEDIVIDYLRSISMELVMIPLVLFVLIKYTRILDEADRQPDMKRRKLNKGKWHLNRNISYPLGAMFSISMVVALSLTGYIQLMSGLSDQNVRAVNNLNALKNRVEQSGQMSRRFEEYHASNIKDILELITWEIEKNPEAQLKQERLQWIAGKIGLESLEVFDGNGVVVAASDNSMGDRLNQDPDSSDAPCQELLLGNSEYAKQELPDNREYFAQARKDADGFVRMIYPMTVKKKLMALDNFETAFISCDFGDATKLYADVNDTSEVYYENPSTMTIERMSYTLPEVLSGDRFNGIITMEGRFLYVNTLRVDSRIFIHAISLRSILMPCLLAVFNECFLFTIVFLILVYSTGLYSEPASRKKGMTGEEETAYTEDDHLYGEPARTATQRYFKNIKERMLEKTFKGMVNFLIRVSLTAVAIIFIVDAVISDSSLYAYLLSNTWTTGVNLSSITKIIIIVVIVWTVSTFLCQIILLITGNLNTRGMTIGHMLSSIVQFASVVFVGIYALVQCGISINSLLAGAGLTGAALAIAGQSVVNDLLSGLFIVFEGKFGVGDWVTIGDWRGQVLEIGVRTTTVALGDDIKIFNNSALGGIIVWSHNMSGAICYVDIDYDEDVERVIRLIHDNRPRYMKAIPEMAEGPLVQGVTDLGDSGMTLRITAYVKDQRYAGIVQRSILKETKKLFDENNVKIPYTQVVIHPGK